MASRASLLRALTSSELKEICKRYGLRGYAGLQQRALADFVGKNTPLSDEELQVLVETLQSDKLLSKIRDGKDHFLMKQVEIVASTEDVIDARVGGYRVVITGLGTPDFSYRCDDKCYDFLYQVQKGRYPFCKHYPSVLAELILTGQANPSEVELNLITEAALKELLSIVDERRREEAVSAVPPVSIELLWEEVRANLPKIACQDAELARETYHDVPERVFEDLLDKAFRILQFETISRRKEHGWDLLLIGAYATPPYLAVVEAKTAASGMYDHLARQPDYIFRLKTYCLDMVRNKLVGVLKDYVRYMVIVAPGFPVDWADVCSRFRVETGGLKLALLPVPSLLHWIQKQQEAPIRMAFFETLFAKEGIITEADVDAMFAEGEADIHALSERAARILADSVQRLAAKSVDARFVRLDDVLAAEIFKHIVAALEPDLVKTGRHEVTGVTTYNLKQDNYAVWGRVLRSLADEFERVLKDYAELVERRSDLKEEVLRGLETP